MAEEPGCSESSEFEPPDEDSDGDLEDVDASVARQGRRKPKKNWKCSNCDYATFFPSRLKRHLRSGRCGPNAGQRFACSHCDARFGAQNLLRTHVAKEHPTKHHCEFCAYSHKVLAMVRRHTQRMHENGTPCTVAGCTATVARNRLKRHLAEEHGDDFYAASAAPQRKRPSELPPLRCPHCSYEPPSDIPPDRRDEDVRIHVENMHQKGLRCPVEYCEQRFPVADIDAHLQEAHPDQIFGLQTSSANFASDVVSTNSMSSMRTASEFDSDGFIDDRDDLSESDVEETNALGDVKKPEPRTKLGRVLSGGEFECVSCEKRFTEKTQLKRHIRRVHEKAYAECKMNSKKAKKRLACVWKDCGKSFVTPGLLEDHLNLHSGKKPYECRQCSQSFHARARFAVHLSKYHQTSIKSFAAVAALLPPKSVTCRD